MQDVSQVIMVFSFNMILLGTAVWVLLRVLEKAIDVLMKWHQYDKRRAEA